jgi:hypothetical protein
LSLKILSRPILVDCPTFDENNGGAIVLHFLVDQMRSIGVDAYAINLGRDYSDVSSPLLRFVKQLNHRRRKGAFSTHPSMDVPLAPPNLIEQAIIVYPETRRNNPLGSSRVVRWLLHEPNFFGVEANFADTDDIFYYKKAFQSAKIPLNDDRLLQVRWQRDDVYKNLQTPRTGKCHMVRKGKYRNEKKGTLNTLVDLSGSIPLDGRSHNEIAKAFNSTELFYSFDLHTMYVYYAVLCGCVPVIVPQKGVSADEWRSGTDCKYGVAYGEDEIEWARSTAPNLLEYIAQRKKNDLLTVRRFINFLATKYN